MKVTETTLQGLLLIEPAIYADGRGYFYESFHESKYAAAGIAGLLQDNQSYSQKGAIRGLHAQCPPFEQGKLVRVIQGRVLDIAVDIRRKSATYGQYFAIELTGENHLQLWIPPGFLHGFSTLEDKTTFAYKVTNYYDKNSEFGVIWNDQNLNINWQIKPEESILSVKDTVLPDFASLNSPF
ncbi:MAG: dTDP-4-dehydrorhamnose 3,5-epimerase [Sphingobacteriaceae bacterium]